MSRVFTADFWRGFLQQVTEATVSRGLLILALLAAYWVTKAIINRVVDASIGRIAAREERLGGREAQLNRFRTLQALVKSIAGYVLLFVLVVMVLDAVGANVSGLITTAGVGGVAIGFGAQKLVRDVISGFFLIAEDQFVVGDYVTIGQATGVVEELGMRITRIRDDQGRLWILANGDISTVTNHSRAAVESAIDIGVAPAADVERAESVINEAGEELFASGEVHGLQAAPRAAGVSGWDAAHTLLRVVVTAEPRSMSGAQLRARDAIHEALRRAEIPVA